MRTAPDSSANERIREAAVGLFSYRSISIKRIIERRLFGIRPNIAITI
jgi:hypothetical protein